MSGLEPSIEDAKAAGEAAVAIWTCATGSASGFPSGVGLPTSTVASTTSINVPPTTPEKKDRTVATTSTVNTSDTNGPNGNSSALDASLGEDDAGADDLGGGSSAGLVGGVVAAVLVALAATAFFVRRAQNSKANAAMTGRQPSSVVHNQAYTANGAAVGLRGTGTQAPPGFATATPSVPLVPSRQRNSSAAAAAAAVEYEEPIKNQMVEYDREKRLSSTEYATCEESSGVAVAAAGSRDSGGLIRNAGNGKGAEKEKENGKGKGKGKEEGKGKGPDRCPKCNAKSQFCTCNVRRGTLDMTLAPPPGKRKGGGSGSRAAQNVGAIPHAGDLSAAGVEYENVVLASSTPGGIIDGAGQGEYASTQGALHQQYNAASSDGDGVDYANTVDGHLSGSQEYEIIETAFASCGNSFGVDGVYAELDNNDGDDFC